MLATRVQSFGRYIFDIKRYPAMEKLFYSDEFVKAAKKICPSHRQVLDPFQFHFIIQVKKIMDLEAQKMKKILKKLKKTKKLRSRVKPYQSTWTQLSWNTQRGFNIPPGYPW